MFDPALRIGVVLGITSMVLRPASTQDGPLPPSPVQLAKVVVETVQERRTVTGDLRARARAAVAANESGRVVALEFDEAMLVEAGALLAKIDDRRLRQDRVQAETDLEVRRAQIEIEAAQKRTAESDLASYRAAEERREGSVSSMTMRGAERDVAVATARLAVAEGEVRRMESMIDLLEIRLDDTEIRAPFSGYVVRRSVELGEWLQPGGEVAVLISSGPVEAWLDVPESFSRAALEDDSDLNVRIEGPGVTLRPTRIRVIRDVDPRSRRFQIVADLDPGDLPVAPGMSVSAALPSGGSKRMAKLPADALVHDGGGYFVYCAVAGADGGLLAQPVNVRIGFWDEAFVFVEPDGVLDGGQVVVEGNERLRPMMPIRPAGATPAATPEPENGR